MASQTSWCISIDTLSVVVAVNYNPPYKGIYLLGHSFFIQSPTQFVNFRHLPTRLSLFTSCACLSDTSLPLRGVEYGNVKLG